MTLIQQEIDALEELSRQLFLETVDLHATKVQTKGIFPKWVTGIDIWEKMWEKPGKLNEPREMLWLYDTGLFFYVKSLNNFKKKSVYRKKNQV